MRWSLFLALLGVFACIDGGASTSWYKGCYHSNNTEWAEPTVSQLVRGSVLECGQFCLGQGYEYMGLHSAEVCTCHNLTSLQHDAVPDLQENCNISCTNGSYFPLPCGGDSSAVSHPVPVSLYSSGGPYLTDLEVAVDADWIVVDTPLVIEAVASLQEYVNISDAWAGTSWSGLISEFTWSIASEVRAENITALAKRHRCRIPFTFTQAGDYIIEVLVQNPLSKLQQSLNVTVIPPEPKDLQVALLTEKEHLPSCIPKHCDIKPKSAVVAVFSNSSVEFEASVSVGRNLTFVLEFSDDDVVYEFEPAMESPQCEERNCTAVVQSHVFEKSGVYEVKVTVSNIYGSITRNLTVVVVNHILSNLSIALHPSSPDVVSPSQPVKFLVKVETASRRDTFLELMLGNNNTRSFTVQEFNTSSLILTEPDHAAIAASYGDGCMLEVEVDHVFLSQGVFSPVLWAYNNISSLNATSSAEILVINKLQGPKLHVPSNAGQNRSTKFHLDLAVKSVNMTVTWTIFTGNGLLIDTQESPSLGLEYVFQSPGHFTVKVTASNIRGNVSISASVYVQVPVAGLSLSLQDRYYAKVGHTVTCLAEVESGSDVIFSWDFQDLPARTNVVSRNMSSIANHTYINPGKYNISVYATNDVNTRRSYLSELFIIQRAVKLIVVESSGSTVLGNATSFRVRVNRATDVEFDFDFGTGRHPGKGSFSKNENNLYFVTHKFPNPGVHVVRVFAHNLVSEVGSEIDVIVEEPVPEFSIAVVGHLIVDRPVVLAAMRGGDVIQRSDLIYTWEIGNVTLTTRSPLMTFTFEEAGLYNVSLSAANSLDLSVGVRSTVRELTIHGDRGQWSLSHCGVAEVGTPCTFLIQGNISSLGHVTVEYSNGHSDPKQALVDPSGWSIVFDSTGLHRVSVRGRVDATISLRPQLQLDSYFIVEQPIAGLQLNGPKVVALQSLSRRIVWEASLDHESHAIYVWTLENNRSLPTTYNEFMHIFTRGGTYTLHVEVFNDVSRTTANLTIVAQHPIVDVEATVPPVVHGQPTNISIFVEGGREFLVHIDFGDGNSANLSSEDASVKVESKAPTGSGPGVPEHRLLVPHRYAAIGEYLVHVNVSNRLSWRDQSKTAKVDEPIAGITIESDSSRVIRLGEVVVVRATVATGNDLSFEWDFSDKKEPKVVSYDNSSEATHKYTIAGTYAVTVKVSNPLYKNPVEKRLAFDILAVREIEDDLDLIHINGAPLILQKNGNWSTKPVQFFAECYTCSHVKFLFDFGDGTQKNVIGVEDSFQSHTGGQFSHRYIAEGRYKTCVTAYNPLNNRTRCSDKPFYVQKPSLGLQLDQPEGYETRFTNSTRFVATITQGTNVTYNWKFGDEQEMLDAGPNVTHRYLNTGMYYVEVTAKNRVAEQKAAAKVYVAHVIQGVDLHVGSQLVATGEGVTFTAYPYPKELAHGLVDYYTWDFDDQKNDTFDNQTIYVWRSAGEKARRTVTVKAHNNVSSAMSEPVDVYVLARVGSVKIEEPVGLPLVNQSMRFQLWIYSGSELNYTWNFGDGTPEQTGNLRTVNHSFTRTGEYQIVVYVENKLNNATAKKTVFITEKFCLPPQITIQTTHPHKLIDGVSITNQLQILRSEEVRIEVELKVNCSITMTTAYTWTVRSSSTGDVVHFDGVPSRVFHDRTLYLPPRSLDYGNYTIDFQVKMNGTIVYTNSTTYIAIIPSKLCSVIDGGILREVSKDKTLVLDGTKSRDPDFPESTDMRYIWTCYLLKLPSNSCFSKNFTGILKQNSSTLTFSAHHLNITSQREEFVFNLTVVKPGRRSDVTSQVLRITDATTWLDVKILCPSCQDMLVNVNQRLAMEAVCSNCQSGDDIEYSWSTDMLISQPEEDPGTQCKPRQVQNGRSLRTSAEHNVLQSIIQPLPPAPGPPVESTVSDRSTTVFPAGIFIPQEEMSDGRGGRGRRQSTETDQDQLPMPDPQPGSSGSSSRGSHARGSGSGGMPFGQIIEPVADQSAPSPRGMSQPSDGVIISLKEEPGKSRNHGIPDPVEEFPGGGRPDKKKTTTTIPPEPTGFPVFEPDEPTKNTDPMIMTKARNPVKLNRNGTATGYNNRAFVLKPGTLERGKVYLFSVTASKKGDPSARGTAFVTFEVNRSPSKGECDIPDSQRESVELEEWYEIFCREWKDPGHEPLSYEVGYRLSEDPDEAYNVLYHGMNPTIAFQLPAGKGENHTVCVHVVISDKLGARTEACVIRIKVLPREPTQGNDTIESQLYKQVTGNDTTFGVYVRQKDDGHVRVYSNFAALYLNRLEPALPGSEERRLRKDTRQTLLSILNSFPIRDQYEIQQTLQAVVQLTEVRTELDPAALDIATALLEKIADSARQISDGSDSMEADVLRYIVRVGSNIMAVSVEGDVEVSTVVPTRVVSEPAGNTVTSIAGVIETLLQGQLETHYIGEKAIQWSSSYISVFADRYNSMSGPYIKVNEASCSLPQDMSAVMKHKHRLSNVTPGGARKNIPTNENCYQAHMITFHENPFKKMDKMAVEIHSEVTSLKVLDCYGEEMKIANLTETNMIKIEIPQKEKENTTVIKHMLKKWQMNLHQFNITETNLNQSLHVHIELDPVQYGRLFPIALLISCGDIPGPDVFRSKTVFSAEENHLPLFLPAGTFNTTGACYMALVDSAYNAGRPRPQEVKVREYTMNTWWGQCLFWDYSKKTWSGEGCHTTAMSTLDRTQCLCNHLTMFASRLDLLPNNLSFTNVEDFFDLYRSPVMFAFISAVLLSYFIAVIICRRMDLHDARKGGVVYLQDNAVTDHQRYEITLETGFRKGAGTTAKISVILHGEEGMSETRELISEDQRPLFERNSRDTFMMTLPDNIGRIWKIQLWHNNSGCSPSWFLSRVTVRDINCETMFYFICEKWLAVEEDEGKVEGEFMSLEGNLGFKKVFWAKGTQYATDFHLWASLFTRPSYSRFSRVQRLTCCLTLLMSYMCLNAMWYRTTVEQYRGEFGLLDLSWRSVVVGAICCAIVIPVNMLIAFLFRRSKVPYPKRVKEDIYKTGKCEHIDLDETVEEPVQPVMTHSILDQSLLNWQSIQEWAQKQWVKRQQSVNTSSESMKPDLPQIQQTKKSETLEQASSGFEDCASQDRTHPTIEVKKSNSSEASSGPSTQSGRRRVRSRRIFLPSFCTYVAWFLSITIILGCAVITMLYGFRFGRTKAVMWLQSFYFSFMFCVFITHPFLILILSIYTAIRYRNDPSILDHHDDGFYGKRRRPHACKKNKKEINCCEECEELERGVNARQRSRYLRFARPPQEKQLIEARKKIMKEKKAYSVLQDYWEFLMFFVVLCSMAFGKNLSSPYYLNESLKNVFVRSGSSPFSGVKNVENWWRWSQTSLLDGLFNHVTYDRNSVSAVQNTNTFIIGHVHLRQLRVTSEQACHPPIQNAIFDTCHEDYESASKAMEPYGPNNTWRHSFYSQYYTLHGRHASYDSSGYVVMLNKSRSEAYNQLADLYNNDWLDVKTRAVIVEFTLFYAPTSLFTSVTLLLETPSTGGAFPYPSIISTYLYRYITVWDNMVLACELFFIIMVLYSVKCVVVEMIKLKSKYIYNPWNVIDVVSSLMSLAYVGCYIYRFVLVYETKEHLLSTYYEKFVDVSTLAHWDEILKAMVGFLLFIVVCKFLHLLRYKKTFSTLGNFYKRAYRELFVFSAMFLVFLLAFTSLGYALFGAFSSNFRDFWVGMGTMTGLLIGCYQFPEFDVYYLIGAKLFIVLYLIIVKGLLTSYMVAVLSYQYKIYRQGEVIAMGCSDTMKFFWDRFLLWAGFKRPPPDEEPDSQLPPEFTMAEIEYQVDELLFRMNAISGSSNLPEKPPCYFTDSDVTYGVGDDGISSGEGSENRPFDEERFEQRIQKIEENLYGNEPYLAQLIKLNSIGADLLSHDREKQLRSHLELEIFRRLQMQRQERGSLRSSDRSTSSGGSYSLPHSPSSNQPSPTVETTGRVKSLARLDCTKLLKTAPASGGTDGSSPEKCQIASDQSKLLSILAPDESSSQKESGVQTQKEGGFPEDLIREALSRELEVPLKQASCKAVSKTKSDSTSGHSSCSDGSKHSHQVMTTSSEDNTQVTGAGARAKIKHGGQPKVKPEIATPNSAKVFSHSSLRDLPPIEITKTSIIDSPQLVQRKPPRGTLSLINPLALRPSATVTESSSGSEQDAHRGRRPASKARTLRKTKSRGKGKGSNRLSTLESLEDDLFDNCGYNTDNTPSYGSTTSDSSKDKSTMGSSSSDTKQAWL